MKRLILLFALSLAIAAGARWHAAAPISPVSPPAMPGMKCRDFPDGSVECVAIGDPIILH